MNKTWSWKEVAMRGIIFVSLLLLCLPWLVMSESRGLQKFLWTLKERGSKSLACNVKIHYHERGNSKYYRVNRVRVPNQVSVLFETGNYTCTYNGKPLKTCELEPELKMDFNVPDTLKHLMRELTRDKYWLKSERYMLNNRGRYENLLKRLNDYFKQINPNARFYVLLITPWPYLQEFLTTAMLSPSHDPFDVSVTFKERIKLFLKYFEKEKPSQYEHVLNIFGGYRPMENFLLNMEDA